MVFLVVVLVVVVVVFVVVVVVFVVVVVAVAAAARGEGAAAVVGVYFLSSWPSPSTTIRATKKNSWIMLSHKGSTSTNVLM